MAPPSSRKWSALWISSLVVLLTAASIAVVYLTTSERKIVVIRQARDILNVGPETRHVTIALAELSQSDVQRVMKRGPQISSVLIEYPFEPEFLTSLADQDSIASLQTEGMALTTIGECMRRMDRLQNFLCQEPRVLENDRLRFPAKATSLRMVAVDAQLEEAQIDGLDSFLYLNPQCSVLIGDRRYGKDAHD